MGNANLFDMSQSEIDCCDSVLTLSIDKDLNVSGVHVARSGTFSTSTLAKMIEVGHSHFVLAFVFLVIELCTVLLFCIILFSLIRFSISFLMRVCIIVYFMCIECCLSHNCCTKRYSLTHTHT